jgi:hypothetical protein
MQALCAARSPSAGLMRRAALSSGYRKKPKAGRPARLAANTPVTVLALGVLAAVREHGKGYPDTHTVSTRTGRRRPGSGALRAGRPDRRRSLRPGRGPRGGARRRRPDAAGHRARRGSASSWATPAPRGSTRATRQTTTGWIAREQIDNGASAVAVPASTSGVAYRARAPRASPATRSGCRPLGPRVSRARQTPDVERRGRLDQPRGRSATQPPRRSTWTSAARASAFGAADARLRSVTRRPASYPVRGAGGRSFVPGDNQRPTVCAPGACSISRCTSAYTTRLSPRGQNAGMLRASALLGATLDCRSISHPSDRGSRSRAVRRAGRHDGPPGSRTEPRHRAPLGRVTMRYTLLPASPFGGYDFSRARPSGPDVGPNRKVPPRRLNTAQLVRSGSARVARP